MTYQIVENDVRLLRRILVARQASDWESAQRITEYLGEKGLAFKLPEQQHERERANYLARFPSNEQWLALKYGCILLPEYDDCIFLNAKWVNPRTLYVRLVEEVPELGPLGTTYWIPEAFAADWSARVQEMYEEYLAAGGRYTAPVVVEDTRPLWKKLFGIQ